MKLGLILCSSELTKDNIDSIDVICRGNWDYPDSVMFYNISTESSSNDLVKDWSNLYFGCKFITEIPKKSRSSSWSSLPSNIILNSSSSSVELSTTPRMSRTSSFGSPRTSSPRSALSNVTSTLSPRQNMSPRKFTNNTIDAINHLADNCTHVIIIGKHENLETIAKTFTKAKLLTI